MKKVIFFVFSSFLVFLTTLYFRLGGHKDVSISTEDFGPYVLLYKIHYGPYHKIADVIAEVEAWAATKNLDCRLTFGEYLDDPRTVDEKRLRSLGGCLLPTDFNETPAPYLTKKLDRKSFVIARFSGAPSIGPMKVYPKVEEYIRERKIERKPSVIEIYDIRGGDAAITTYLF